ncbi:MAG TPA: putative toxin-antitoxin system toxin component, PIN family [Pirellulales bacterium]|nr:putative toxin-antitoxin system toxin component, PIN family [Pirellulales bacterium]
MKIVCDTNVLVRAAINPNGLASELLRRIRLGHALVASYPLLVETLDVLRRPRIQSLHGRDEHGIRRFISSLYKVAIIVRIPQSLPRVIPSDPKDDFVLITAIGGQASILTTRDQHFFDPGVLAFAAVHGLRIVRDDQLLHELRADQS